jgi:hypothetical protein
MVSSPFLLDIEDADLKTPDFQFMMLYDKSHYNRH